MELGDAKFKEVLHAFLQLLSVIMNEGMAHDTSMMAEQQRPALFAGDGLSFTSGVTSSAPSSHDAKQNKEKRSEPSTLAEQLLHALNPTIAGTDAATTSAASSASAPPPTTTANKFNFTHVIGSESFKSAIVNLTTSMAAIFGVEGSALLQDSEEESSLFEELLSLLLGVSTLSPEAVERFSKRFFSSFPDGLMGAVSGLVMGDDSQFRRSLVRLMTVMLKFHHCGCSPAGILPVFPWPPCSSPCFDLLFFPTVSRPSAVTAAVDRSIAAFWCRWWTGGHYLSEGTHLFV